MDILRNIGKQSGESVWSQSRKRKKGYSGKDMLKRKGLRLE